jgi:IS30 family transposase
VYNEDMQLSHETIYKTIFIQGKTELRDELKKLMRQRRVYRKHQKTLGEREKQRFREPMVMISDRPKEVEDRVIPGNWEGDLIMGKNNKSAIGTVVERTTRYCVLLHLPNRHTADELQKAIVKKFKHLPEHLVKSLTWDQGSELALHSKISKELNLDVYFCDPRSPMSKRYK